MKGRSLRDQLKLTEGFRSPEEEVFLGLQRTTETLGAQVNGLFRSADLSPSQYNVLRILEGTGAPGISGREIGERMVTRDSDLTRLLDGLESRDLVRRARCEQDRRVVRARITRRGSRLLDGLDEPLKKIHRAQLGHLGRKRLGELSRLLERARERVAE